MNNESDKKFFRPPVVVVMGHIDHGKTTLLDFIRKTKVAEKETGAITQHIGAYEVLIPFKPSARKITFLDTPGHEAFNEMRARGARVADIAILVVAADEGVQAQTKEAFEHIKAANIPFLVAINKIDKPAANLEKVKKELADIGILIEEWGGSVPAVNISAKTGQGIDQLLELILLMAEMEGLTYEECPAYGVVIESFLDSRRGYTATLLIRNGILQKGDIIHLGDSVTPVKIMEDYRGESIEKAVASQPILVVGFEHLPKIGDVFYAGDNPPPEIKQWSRLSEIMARRMSDVIFLGSNQERVISLIIKTDVLGSVEPLINSLKEISQDRDVSFKILKTEVGDISEVDYKLADASSALILAFRVKVRPEIKNILSSANIGILFGQTIYELKEALEKYLEEEINKFNKPQIIGRAKILALFNPVKGKPVVGGEVIEGVLEVARKIEIYRGEEKIGEGQILNLQSFKKDVTSVGTPNQCGMHLDTNVSLAQGDIIYCLK